MVAAGFFGTVSVDSILNSLNRDSEHRSSWLEFGFFVSDSSDDDLQDLKSLDFDVVSI